MLIVALGFAMPALQAAETPGPVPTTTLEKEAHGMAMLLERDILAKSPGFMERSFDLEACLDRALDGLNAPSGLEDNFRKGVRESFVPTFTKALSQASSVRFLRMRQVDKESRFVFRVVPKEGGVNYFEFVFERTRRNGVRAVDLYNYSLGQKLTYIFRHAFIPIAHAADSGWSSHLSKKDTEFLEHFQELGTMQMYNAQMRFTDCLAVYAKLPASLQKEKLFLFPELQAGIQADNGAFQAAMTRWRETYPGETSIDLVVANLYFAKRNYELAFAALDRFEKTFGADAYLDVLRAQQYKNQDRFDEARACARKATSKNPRMSEGWETLISVGLSKRNYDEVAQVLTEWESKTSIDVFRVATGDKYYDFKRSAAGRQWFADRDGKRQAAASTSTSASTAPATATSTSGSASSGGSIKAAARTPTPEAVPKTGYKLQGIFYSASNPSAIISGRTVFNGDHLAGGFKVEKISQLSVTLKSPEGELLELALK